MSRVPNFKFSLNLLICILAVFSLAFLGATKGIIDVAHAVPTVKDPSLQVQTVASGLNLPTSMAFVGPNDILVLEKNTGQVKRVKDGIVLSPPLIDFHVATESERGLLGIDVIKTSSIHHYVFLYWSKAHPMDGGTPIGNLLSRFIFTNNPDLGPAQGSLTSPRTLLKLPITPGPNHDGGKVAVSSSGHVYAVIGDLNRQGKVQNFENGPAADGTGGVLRVTRDGGVVAPTVLGSTYPLYLYHAYGVRNSFGIDFDPMTGRLWDTENGPSSNDEINLVGKPGFNSGWRDIMGMAPQGFNFNNLESFGGRGYYSNPEFVWKEVVAPTAIEFLNSGSLGSSYQNDMFVGDFNKGRIYDFTPNSNRDGLALTGPLLDKIADTDLETQSVVFGEGFGGISDLKVGLGDGYLYVLSISNGAIYKILPKVQAASLQSDTSSQETIDKSNEDKRRSDCERLSKRLEQVQEERDSGILEEEDAHDLRERIESFRNNLDCG